MNKLEQVVLSHVEDLKGVVAILRNTPFTRTADEVQEAIYELLDAVIKGKAQEKSNNTYCKHGFDMSKCKCPKCESGID